MADNTTLNVGSGGDVIAADDISGVKYQRIKLIHGVDGVNDGDVAKTNPFPVSRPNVYGTKTTLADGTLSAGSTKGDMLVSLASGSSVQLTAIDNSTTRYRNFRIRIKTKGVAGSTASINVYVAQSLGDSTYADGASGTAGTFTGTIGNAVFVGAVKMNGTTAVIGEVQFPPWFEPGDSITIILNNASGGALSATGSDHLVEYEGIY